MKKNRHAKILEIIENYPVETQEMLQAKLLKSGYEVTQATVSRDIRELKLIKTLSEDGIYKYSLPTGIRDKNPLSALKALLSEAVITIDNAINTVVIKCHAGMGNAVCAKLDNAEFDNIIGTLAGDDTIFVLFKTEYEAEEMVEKLRTLINKQVI